MRYILISMLLIEILFSVDLAVENLSKEVSKESPDREKIYFGSSLFQGEFKKNSQIRYRAEYIINVGDRVSIKLWGSYNYEGRLKVDTKGNIFIPRVGTVHLLGVKSGDLEKRVASSVRRVFNSNVFLYANLEGYQPISIFVTGAVKRQGLYEGLASNSILQFLDRAGGVVDGEGSYRNILVLRDNRVVKRFDLYQFLVNGELSLFQFHDGDVIRVDTIKSSIDVTGEVERAYSFELSSNSVLVSEVIKYAVPKPTVTHFIVTKWEGGVEKINKYPIEERYRVYVKNGDKIRFVSDYLKDNLTIKIDGEHGNLHTVMVKKGENLKDLLSKIILTPLSDANAVQLYRESVALRQKRLIDANLKDLEARVMTTGSSTVEEAKIRQEESALVLDFIKRASKIRPKGQVIINRTTNLSNVILEDGDRVFIPKKSHIIVVEGEVSLPNAQTFVPNYSISDYIDSCGGFSPRANREKVLLVKKNGQVITYNAKSWWSDRELEIEAGDSILVLGKIDSKSIQITSSVTQILYQIAVGAAVVLRAF